MEGTVKDLSAYRFEKAVRNLEVAERLLGEMEYDFCLNRSYYAVFDAMLAVNALDGFDSGKHSGVIAHFNQNYVKTGKFDSSMSDIIKHTSTLREKSDYEDYYKASPEEAEDALEQAKVFIQAVAAFLQAEEVFSSVSIKHISPYRTEDLKAVLSVVPDSVEEIWVFGSTVTPYCRPQSDLDLCIVGHTTIQEESRMYKAAKCAVDIITETPEGFIKQQKTPGSVYKEVVDKGLLVYKKGQSIKWT